MERIYAFHTYFQEGSWYMKSFRNIVFLILIILILSPLFSQVKKSEQSQKSEIFKEDPKLTKSLQDILKKHKLDIPLKTKEGKSESVSLVVVDLFDPDNPVYGAINPHLKLNPAGMERIFIANAAMDQIVKGAYELDTIIIVNEPNIVKFPVLPYDLRPIIKVGDYESIVLLIDFLLTRNDLTCANELIDIVSREKIAEFIKTNEFNDTIVNKKYKVDPAIDYPKLTDLTDNSTSAYDVAKLFYLMYMTEILDPEKAELTRRYFRRNLVKGYMMDGLGEDSVFYHFSVSENGYTHEAGIVVQKKLSYIISLFTPLSEEKAKEIFPDLTYDIHCLIIDRAIERVKKEK